MADNIFRTKPVSDLISESTGEQGLRKALGPFALVTLGIGAIIGTGIFVLTGIGATKAGPALVVSFILAGLACAFAALCYAEFAAMVPVAGSAYTYGYASLGEFWAWIIGWDLILEYTVAVSAVAIGWSYYCTVVLNFFNITLPKAISNAPFSFDPEAGKMILSGDVMNLPAMLVLVVIGALLVIGVKESANFNSVIVTVKVSIVLLFIVLGVGHVDPSNWSPFLPYGWSGVFSGASMIVFAYLGFDAVSTAAEEAKNPQKDLPIGIIGSLVVCTILYIIVSALLTGMVPYTDYFKPEAAAPVAYALGKVGIGWGATMVSFGALFGLTTVLLVMMYGQTRVFFAMSRDGLLPKFFGEVNHKFGTPVKSTLLVATSCIIIAGFFPIGVVAELCNIGTLAAFVIVSASVIVMRKRRPDVERGFKCPWVPIIPALGIIFNLFLIINLETATHIRFLVWLVIGIVIYFTYSRSHSTMSINVK